MPGPIVAHSGLGPMLRHDSRPHCVERRLNPAHVQHSMAILYATSNHAATAKTCPRKPGPARASRRGPIIPAGYFSGCRRRAILPKPLSRLHRAP